MLIIPEWSKRSKMRTATSWNEESEIFALICTVTARTTERGNVKTAVLWHKLTLF